MCNIFLFVNNNNGDNMKVRLGYACISNAINQTSSRPYTYNEYLNKGNIEKLDNVIVSNLDGLKSIIEYNIKNNIHFYRMSSKIIPLATKDDVIFDYIDRYKDIYTTISRLIKENSIRVDFHPDQFCVLNSTKIEIVQNSIKILEYYYNLLDVLDIEDKVLILHVGSSVFGKDNSIKRFINNFNKLPEYLKKTIVIENDDKIFNVSDVCFISDILGIPVVLDYHHHICNKSEIDIMKIFNSWGKRTPKIHFSSSKNIKDFRSHADYINSDSFITFIEHIKKYDVDVDIMIEAKAKDDALFRLIRELKYKTNYSFIDETTFCV